MEKYNFTMCKKIIDIFGGNTVFSYFCSGFSTKQDDIAKNPLSEASCNKGSQDP